MIIALSMITIGVGGLYRPVHSQTQVAITYFDEALSADGDWVWHPTYGRVWRPRQVGPEWRPYMYGRWVYTREYGWVWVSEERWGWVVYHYGHWVWTSQYGWVWVARDVWAPSWVEWCYGGGYVGWSPMPPDPFWTDGRYYGSWDCASPRYSSRWVYVSETNFATASVSANVVLPAQVMTVARATVNVTNYSRSGSGIINRSVDVAKLQAATGKTIRPVRVVQSAQPVPAQLATKNLQELKIYRPSIARSDLSKKSPTSPSGLDLEPRKDGLVLSPKADDQGGLPGTLPPATRQPPELIPPTPPIGPPPAGGILGGKGGGGGLFRR